jgi:hypothetical protein
MLPGNLHLPTGALLVLVGLVACFAGYRLLRAVLTVYGFLLGAYFASSLVSPGDTTALLVALVVGGLLGAVALYAGYFAGVGLLGAGLGATVAYSAWHQWRGADPGVFVIMFFAALGAGLAVTMQRVIVIVATAFFGSQTAVAGALALLSRQPARRSVEDLWTGHLGIPQFGLGRQWTFVAWVALGVLGTVVQLRAGGPRKKKT